MFNFFKGPVEKRVMSIVRNLVLEIEKAHEVFCANADEKLKTDTQVLELATEESKSAHLESSVQSLAGKLLV